MRTLTIPAVLALALAGWAATAAAEPKVRVFSTDPDATGAACGVAVVGGEADVQVVPLGDPGDAVGWASSVLAPGGPRKKMKLPFLGVATSSPSEALRKQINLPPGTGLVVDYVAEESPAHEAGIKAHDVLTQLGDQILVNPPQLAVLVRLRKAGDAVPVTLMRGGKEQQVKATLTEKEQWVTTGGSGVGAATFGGIVPPIQAEKLKDLLKQGNVSVRIQPQDAGQGEKAEAEKPFGGTVATAFSMTMADGEHTLTIDQRDGKRHLVAKDANGNVLFDGPISTDAERAKVPEDILKKLNRMAPHVDVRMHMGDTLQEAKRRVEEARQRAEAERKRIQEKVRPHKHALPRVEAHSSGQGHAAVHIQDQEHDLRITSKDGKQHLVAKDAEGNVLFDGPISTDEDMAKVPEAIREKVKGIRVQSGGSNSDGKAL